MSPVDRDDLEALFRSSVTPEEVAEVLVAATELPNRRDRPTEDDLPGAWDFWFDHGAARVDAEGTRFALDGEIEMELAEKAIEKAAEPSAKASDGSSASSECEWASTEATIRFAEDRTVRVRCTTELRVVAEMLFTIASPPNRRDDDEEGDLDGEWDFWFDGGAGRMETGITRYRFADGAEVLSGGEVPWRLDVSMRFPDGREACVRQTEPALGV